MLLNDELRLPNGRRLICLSAFISTLPIHSPANFSDYRGLKQMIASIAEEAHKSESDGSQHKQPVLSDVQLHLDSGSSTKEICSSSQPPEPLHSRIASAQETKNRISFQLSQELVRDFLNMRDHTADSEPRLSPSRKSWQSSTPRPISLQTLSNAFRAGSTSQSRRKYHWSLKACY